MYKVVISGSSGGIGRYLFEHFGGIGLTRKTLPGLLPKLKKTGAGIIIHCASNASKNITTNNLYDYYCDNIRLTNELLNIPHNKFIYFSSADVYPKDGACHAEDEEIALNAGQGIYATSKLICESLVRRLSPYGIILRPTSLLGSFMRENTLTKIMAQPRPRVTLARSSSLNFLLYADVLEAITRLISSGPAGIYNLSSSKNIPLSEIASFFKKRVSFGVFKYSVGNISSRKISSFTRVFKKSSREKLEEFVKSQ